MFYIINVIYYLYAPHLNYFRIAMDIQEATDQVQLAEIARVAAVVDGSVITVISNVVDEVEGVGMEVAAQVATTTTITTVAMAEERQPYW